MQQAQLLLIKERYHQNGLICLLPLDGNVPPHEPVRKAQVGYDGVHGNDQVVQARLNLSHGDKEHFHHMKDKSL